MFSEHTPMSFKYIGTGLAVTATASVAIRTALKVNKPFTLSEVVLYVPVAVVCIPLWPLVLGTMPVFYVATKLHC